jgi:hypothetical protein
MKRNLVYAQFILPFLAANIFAASDLRGPAMQDLFNAAGDQPSAAVPLVGHGRAVSNVDALLQEITGNPLVQVQYSPSQPAEVFIRLRDLELPILNGRVPAGDVLGKYGITVSVSPNTRLNVV